MNLPMPLIPEAVLVRGARPLQGPIGMGEVFAWEPDLPDARELAIVSRLEPDLVWTWDIHYSKEVWNDETRFREAVVRTRFNRFPPQKPPVFTSWTPMTELYARQVMDAAAAARSDARFIISTRPEVWDVRFMRLAAEVAEWSKDPRCRVGAVVVSPDRRQVAVGYNGFPPSIRDTRARLVDRETKNRLMLHAERNALDNVAFDPSGATLYVTLCPCLQCALAIVSRRVATVVCPPVDVDSTWGPSQVDGLDILAEAKVEVRFLARSSFSVR